MPAIDASVHYRIFWLTLGAASLFLVTLGAQWLRRPPQMGSDENVFKTVDALFTAINSHDLPRIKDCAERLDQSRQAGELPAAAASRLDSIVKQAHAGQWDSAAHQLYDFMLGQRRTT